MARLLKIFLITILLLGYNSLKAQTIPISDLNFLDEFKATAGAENRFQFFYNTINRYNENSAYDWLDAVTIFIRDAEREQDSVGIKFYQFMRSQIHYDLGDYDKSVELARDLYTTDNGFSQPVVSRLLDLMDANYASLKLYEKQIEVRKFKRELGVTENIAFYDIYSNLGLHRQAMEDYINDVKKTIADSDLYGLAKYNNQVGQYLLMDGSPSVALANFTKARSFLKIFLADINMVKTAREIQGANLLHGIIEGNIGKCKLNLKQYEESLAYLENSLSLIKEYNIGVFSEELVENTLALAESHLRLNNPEMALEYLNSNIQLKQADHLLRYNRLTASYFNSIGDFERESDYLKRNVRIQDSIQQLESTLRKQQLVAVVAKEDLDSSKKLIDEQKEEMKRARSDLAAKDDRITLVFISLVFTLLGFAGLVYAYLKSIKNQRLIAEQKFIIENSLVEKDSLLKEIHHRVKNNLQMVSSLLSLQTKNTRSKAAIEALEEGKSRVKAMALIHQKLYQNDDLSVIEMQGYIESLVNSVQSVFKKGSSKINITIDAEGVELDIDRAIPFGLILNELVSNSFKYAFPEEKDNGKIYIHLRKNKEQGFFEYTDNGVGLPPNYEDQVDTSMGIKLINRLVNQLQSTLNIDKTSEGVRFWFNFK